MTAIAEGGAPTLSAGQGGYGPIEDRLRAMARQTIETMVEEELAEALDRARYARGGRANASFKPHVDSLAVTPMTPEPCQRPRNRRRFTPRFGPIVDPAARIA